MAVLAPAIATVPYLAMINPLFCTYGATSATSPPSFAVIVPSLMILAFGFDGVINRIFPAIKSSFLIFAVLATSAATSTFEPLPKSIPFWFISISPPFAVICPNIFDGSLPTTRLRSIAFDEG